MPSNTRVVKQRSWFVLFALTAFLLSSLMTGCIVRTGNSNRASRGHAAKHKHRHCHYRGGKHRKKKCHSHVHSHGRRGGGHH